MRTLLLAAVCWASIASAAPVTPAQVDQLEMVHLLIPGGAGGGWDRTARGVGDALSRSGLVDLVRYENLSGGGGGRAIAHLIEVDDPTVLMVNSTPIVVRALQGVFPHSFRDLVPIASVIGDYSVIAVRTASPIENLAQLARLQRSAPRKLSIGGGSVPGGTDHIVAALLIKSLGNDPATTKYIPYDAGGKAMAGLLSGEVQALSSGYGEVMDMVAQGWVRLLCIAAPARVPSAPDTPTCEEAGAAGAVFVNWRGFFAAPSISDAQAEQYRALLQAMIQTETWQEIRTRNGWVDLFQSGPAFLALLEAQERTIGTLMHELGLLQ